MCKLDFEEIVLKKFKVNYIVFDSASFFIQIFEEQNSEIRR